LVIEQHLRAASLLTFMLRFICDYCGNVKQPNETWINGVAAECVGTRAARREVLIDPRWRYERAVLPLAVHFCSFDCKDSYLTELFDTPPTLLEFESAGVVSTTTVKRSSAKEPSAAASLKRRSSKSGRRTRTR
jgi:hypothetical protein